ncbi:MAG: S-methyl-5-thioribose kinase [Subdoligranulum sp.]|nr:S-methyl-5-thioribose kinase [Subdoligranulum sp.]MBD5101709.1 S-methyl-5-thioribose kinase [Subdoligranulum sp.]
MSKFESHFKMNESDAVEYVREKLPDFFGQAPLLCREIGDGNINYVFRVETQDGTKSLIVKHADQFSRSSHNPASTDRNRIEAEILAIERNLSPEHVPEIYLYDPVMCCVVMQDVGDHQNMRYAMIAHKTFSTLAGDIAEFMASTLMRTTDLILTPAQKKKYMGQFINPSMCDITERLVYTDPYKNASGHNIVFEPNREFLERELYGDASLHREAAKLKCIFQSKAQSLIHGDLHSGSIFVKEGSTMVLDPEFAFYGPAGYDVGNVVAHLVFAWANAAVTEKDEKKKETFQHWVEQTVEQTVDLFVEKSERILKSECRDRMFATDGFAEWYLRDILKDTAGSAGTELIRRVIGTAKVKDLECVEDPDDRVLMERICVLAAKRFIMEREDGFMKGSAYVAAIKDAAEKSRLVKR